MANHAAPAVVMMVERQQVIADLIPVRDDHSLQD
jgi:hypothetical protein